MRKETKKKNGKLLWILLATAALLLVALLLLIPQQETAAPEETDPTLSQDDTEAAESSGRILSEAIRIDRIEAYTGIYVEDGSDDAVVDRLMMVVTNVTADPIQYARIQLDLGGKTAEFAVSVLPAGGTAILIEQNRMKYDPEMDYDTAPAECVNIAGFEREMNRCEDQLEIQLLDGGVNIRNSSGSDIIGDITLCYKNVVNGMYHGGIAYRIRLEGGLKAGELRQLMTNHVQKDGTEIMFAEIVE